MHDVILYARTSTEDKQTTDSQRYALEEWATRNNITATYIEEQTSGRSMKRPQLEKIIKLIKEGKIKQIVVWKLSRIGRNVKGILEFLDVAARHEVSVISLTEHLDATTGVGRAFITLIAVFDRLTSDTISENTKAGLRASKKPKELLSGARLAGYLWFSRATLAKKGTIFTLHKAGKSIREIVRGTGVDRNTIRKMIRLPESLVMSKKQVEALAKAVREGRTTNPFTAFKDDITEQAS